MRRVLLGCALAGTLLLSALAGTAAADDPAPASERLYLVTLSGPGSLGYRGPLSETDYRTWMVRNQDATLEAIDAGEPVYRWTAALNGVAVELTDEQADAARSHPLVQLVEADEVHQLAGGASAPATAASAAPGRGGQGTVIGFIDTGLAPSGPAFASAPGLGPVPRDFDGACPAVDGWPEGTCDDKVVAARHFVAGFGADRLRAGASASPWDDNGHGTQVASIAAGNAEVSAIARGKRLGSFSGAAPRARIAVYKACWSAPDPADDGCSRADVVAAIDQAASDGVDVLNLSVTGAPGLDTVDLALLGATENDVFVAAAAGNEAHTGGYEQPWATTVGATTGPPRRGELVLDDGTTVTGVLTARRTGGDAELVAGEDVPAPGFTSEQARVCTPGSLDAAGAADRIVVCDRGGGVARVDKSSAVRLADGTGMVLVNVGGGDLSADYHAVPTLHVRAKPGDRLRTALRRPGPLRGQFTRLPARERKPRVMAWSGRGARDGSVVKPDLVAPGSGMLSVAPQGGGGWALLNGTSASTAHVAGVAARIRSAHPHWRVARVRSALTTSGTSTRGEPTSLRQGAGVPDVDVAVHPGLAFDLAPGDLRSALRSGSVAELNLPSVLRQQPRRSVVVTREVTNVGNRPAYYSSTAWGMEGHRLQVTPAAIRIAPGETREMRIRITPRPGAAPQVDSGWVAWRGADGTRVRIPVVLTRR